MAREIRKAGLEVARLPYLLALSTATLPQRGKKADQPIFAKI